MEQLEAAANILMASHEVSAGDRQMAENAILEFRKVSNPYNMCREILERSRNEYVLFEAANLLGHSIVKDWRDICQGQGIELKTYLLQYLVSNPHLFHSVRENIVMAIAFIIEKEETPLWHREKYYTEALHLLNSGNPHMCVLACCIIKAICQEKLGLDSMACFPCNSKHKEFEVSHLLKIYQSVLKLLSDISGDTKVGSDLMPVLLKLVLLAEEILTWPFMRASKYMEQRVSPHRRHLKSSVYMQGLFEPFIEWKQTVLSEETISVFFRLYEKFKDDWQLSHHLMVCLVQLSTLSGECVADANENLVYVKSLCSHLHRYLSVHTATESEALGLALIIMKISLSNHNLKPHGILADAMSSVLGDTFELTLQFIAGSAEERYADPEDQLYTEALDKILIAIEAIDNCNSRNPSRSQLLLPYFNKIFCHYVEYHLSPPDGRRAVTKDDEEVKEDAQPDYMFYGIQLSLVTHLACTQIPNCLLYLSHLLEKKVEEFRSLLTRPAADEAACINVFEDLYWLLMIAGQVLDTPSNLDQLRSFNTEWRDTHKNPESFNISAALIMHPNRKIHEFPEEDIRKAHPFMRMLSAVFRLWKLDLDTVVTDNAVLLSPEVSSTLAWFMRKFFSHSYFPNGGCDIFRRIIPEYVHEWMLNFAVATIGPMLRKRSGEPAIIDNYCKLLLELPSGYYHCETKVAKTESFLDLVELSHSGELSNFSRTAQMGLLTGLVRCGVAFRRGSPMQPFWRNLIDVHFDKFNSIARSPDCLRRNCPEVVKKVLYHVDNLTAICNGVDIEIGEIVFLRVPVGLRLAMTCLDVCHNYNSVVEAVMEAFEACSECLPKITRANVSQFYFIVMEMLAIYERHGIGKRTYISNADEEDRLMDLQCIMRIIINIINGDNMCYYTDENTTMRGNGICLYGLGLVVPLMSADLIKEPDICMVFFSLLKEFVIKNSQYLLQLEDVLKDVLGWLELGLNSYGSEISYMCFDSIGHIGTFLKKDPTHGLRPFLRPFMKIILTLIFTHEVNSDAVDESCFAVTELLTLYTEDFNEFMTGAIQAQTSPGLQVKLQECCRLLVEAIHQQRGNELAIDVTENYEIFLSLVAMCDTRATGSRISPPEENRFSMRNLSIALASS